MFENVGGKIQTAAKVVFWILCIIDVGAGIAIAAILLDEFIAIGIALAVLGPLGAWLISLLVYGFGEIVEEAEKKRNGEMGSFVLDKSAEAEKNSADDVLPEL